MRDLILPIGLLLQVIGRLTIAYSISLPILTPAGLILGMGFGLSISYIFTWLDEVTPKIQLILQLRQY